MSINGNLRTLIAAAGILATAGGVAVGYGTLRADVSDNTLDITELREEVREAKSNAGASAAGASLQAQINEVNRRLDRIEGQNTEILRLLTRMGRP